MSDVVARRGSLFSIREVDQAKGGLASLPRYTMVSPREEATGSSIDRQSTLNLSGGAVGAHPGADVVGELDTDGTSKSSFSPDFLVPRMSCAKLC
ncbi:hypothetical protein XI06_12895 [Bradyrhizobium sp. CCBAU 11434]|nr:hypothetical protein [Bradyrhizobium sp. CCBAU 11434]